MFRKSGDVENFLNTMGADWKWTNKIQYSDLSPGWDVANYGRSKTRVEDAVIEYASRTEAGSPMPGGIFRTVERGVDILDGVQRLLAGQLLGLTMLSGYMVQTDSEMLARAIRVCANTWLGGGHHESSAWTRKMAVQLLIIEGTMSVQEVAKLCGWKVKDVEDDKLAAEIGFAIRTIGGPEELPKGVLLQIKNAARMHDFNVAREPIAAFCTDLKTGKFSNGDSQMHIEQFFDTSTLEKKIPLHDQYSERLEQFRSHPEVKVRLEGRRPTRLGPDIKLRKEMRSALSVAEGIAKRGDTIPYMEEYYQLWNQVRDALKKIARK